MLRSHDGKPLGFGGPIGSMRDPELEIRVNPRAFGTYSFKVMNPELFISQYIGQTGGVGPDEALDWVRKQILMGLKSTMTNMIKSGDLTMMDLGTCGPDVAQAIVQSCPDLEQYGIKVLSCRRSTSTCPKRTRTASTNSKTRSFRRRSTRAKRRSASVRPRRRRAASV